MPSGIEMAKASSVSYVVGTVCFMISGKFSINWSSTIVGGGNIVGEIPPRTVTACHATMKRTAVMTGKTNAESWFDQIFVRTVAAPIAGTGTGAGVACSSIIA